MGREGTSRKGWDGGWRRFKLFFVSYYLLSFFFLLAFMSALFKCWFYDVSHCTTPC